MGLLDAQLNGQVGSIRSEPYRRVASFHRPNTKSFAPLCRHDAAKECSHSGYVQLGKITTFSSEPLVSSPGLLPSALRLCLRNVYMMSLDRLMDCPWMMSQCSPIPSLSQLSVTHSFTRRLSYFGPSTTSLILPRTPPIDIYLPLNLSIPHPHLLPLSQSPLDQYNVYSDAKQQLC